MFKEAGDVLLTRDDGHGPEAGGGRGRGGGGVPRRGLPRHRVLARRRGEARGFTVPQEVS